MESCQRNIFGEIISETGFILPVCLVIDSSGTMGDYLPEEVEAAVNLFFKNIGAVEEADELIEVCVFESHDEVEFLGGFDHASSFMLDDLRYGGGWNLSDAVSQAVEVIMKHVQMLDRNNRLHAISMIVVISDNPVSDECARYASVDKIVSKGKSSCYQMPRILFVSSASGNHFEHHIPNIEFHQAGKAELDSCMLSIAREAINTVRPRSLIGLSSRGETDFGSEVLK